MNSNSGYKTFLPVLSKNQNCSRIETKFLRHILKIFFFAILDPPMWERDSSLTSSPSGFRPGEGGGGRARDSRWCVYADGPFRAGDAMAVCAKNSGGGSQVQGHRRLTPFPCRRHPLTYHPWYTHIGASEPRQWRIESRGGPVALRFRARKSTESETGWDDGSVSLARSIYYRLFSHRCEGKFNSLCERSPRVSEKSVLYSVPYSFCRSFSGLVTDVLRILTFNIY